MNIRPATLGDQAFLAAMMFEAFHWDDRAARPPFAEFFGHPEFQKLLGGWGRPGDRALIADVRGKPLGAAWFRLWSATEHSYGFVDAKTPELGIAVVRSYRRRGIGRVLTSALIETGRADGFDALSLSVSPENPARGLYESIGFVKVGESGTSWTLRLPLTAR